MSKTILTRFTWTDDSGAGLDGTIINNAQLQDIFDAVDEAIGQVVQIKTGAYTAVATDDLIKATSGTWTLTLFTAVGNDGKKLAIVNRGSGVITVDPNGAQTIDGLSTVTLLTGEAILICSDGANWVIEAQKTATGLRQVVRGLRLSTHFSATEEANKVMLLSLDEVQMNDGVRYTSVPLLTADITAGGAGGLDAGARTASRWYEIWAIGKTSTLLSSDVRLLLHEAMRRPVETSFTTTPDTSRALRLATATPTDKIAQGMQFGTTGPLPYVDLQLLRVLNPTGNIWVTIEGDNAGNPNGTPIATSDKYAVANSGLDAGSTRFRFLFTTPATLTGGTQYHLVLQGDYAKSDTDYVAWSGLVAGGYASGSSKEFNGGAWAGTAGANGLDRTFVAYREIASAALTYPGGYDHGCLLGYVYNNGSNALVPFAQVDRHVSGFMSNDYRVFTGAGTGWPALYDLSAIVPPVNCHMTQFFLFGNGAISGIFYFRPTRYGNGLHWATLPTKTQVVQTWTTGAYSVVAAAGAIDYQSAVILGPSNGGANCDGWITGWRF